MAALTLDGFLNHLEEDLAWRKYEITRLVLLHNESDDLIICKSLILLIYSHWEGYIKNACKKYLVHIADKKIKLTVLTKNFGAIALKGFVSETYKSTNSLTLANEITLINKIHEMGGKKFILSSNIMEEKNKEFINTKDNLNLKCLNSFCKIVGICEITMIEKRGKYIDEVLLNQRNAISHGSKVDSTSSEFNLKIDDVKELRDFIFFIMEYIKEELAFFAENEYYLIEKIDSVTARHDSTSNKLNTEMSKLFTD